MSSSDSDSQESQVIILQNNDTSATYRIRSTNVEIRATKSAPQQNRQIASNKIKVNKIVSYEWEQKYNYGNIVAVHKNDEFLAYSLKVKNAGNVRIFHRKLNIRSLLSNFNGRVVDLSFAHYDEILLGCVDEAAVVQVFKLELDSKSSIQAHLLFHLLPSASFENISLTAEYHRLIWCIYIPENDPTAADNLIEDASKVFVVTTDKQIDIYHLDLITQNYDTKEAINSDNIEKGHLRINEHESTVLTASFSPDGSAIATGCMHGEVKFFKLSFAPEIEPPRCLQRWTPHQDKPITSLYFLDDHKNPSPNAQFWSYLLTGCDNNREVKVWCCIKWKCLQTINFTSDDDVVPCLKTAIDLSSSHFLMSDINRKVCYVLHLNQDHLTAKVTAISEYPLTCPALSFAVHDSNRVRTKKFNRISSTSNAENETEQPETVVTAIQLYCIQTKQFSEMQILVNSDANVPPSPLLANSANSNSAQLLSSSLSFNSDLKDHLSDVLSDLEQDLNSSRSTLAAKSATNKLNLSNSSTPILLTPDAFSNTQVKRLTSHDNAKTPTDVLKSLISSSRTSSLTNVTSCVNAPTSKSPVVNTPSTVVGNITPSSVSKANNIESEIKTTDDAVAEMNISPRRILSTSSSSSTSSSGLSDAADKEIESISLPVNYENPMAESQPNEENITDKMSFMYIKNDPKPSHTPPNSVQANLLSKVDMIENDYENDASLLNGNAGDNQHNWPNPPMLSSSSKQRLNAKNSIESSSSSQQPQQVDSNLVLELIHMMRAQQNELELLKKQQMNSVLSLKAHFDSTVQTVRQSSNSTVVTNGTASGGSLILNEDNLSSIINHAITTQIKPCLERFVKEEIRQTIQPQVIKMIEPFREQIPREIAEKLRATENVLKDNIGKMFKSKSFLDSISLSLGNSIQASVVNSYRDTFQKVVIPSFEKSCQTMYQQINATFKKGSDDYIQELENHLKQQRKIYDEQKDPLINQLKQYNEGVQSTLTQVNNSLANSLQLQLDQNLRTSNAVLQDTIISSVKAIIKEELNLAMRDQQQNLPDRLVTAMRQSGTMTPVVYHTSAALDAPHELDPKQRITSLIQSRQFNSAFQVALCASDLNLLMHVCENIKPNEVFEIKPCPLQQPVLLSLIQQLSQELHAHTELKLKYLEEAIMNLDLNNAMTHEHGPNVLNLLKQNLSKYIQAHPNDKSTKSMRMLLMASQSLLRS